MSTSPREHLSADQWREIAYAKHYGRTGYEAHDMSDAINLLLGEIALLRDERDAATGQHRLQSVRLVWPIAYAAGVRDQEAEDFAELNHMSTQCDRANEVAANAEQRCERVVKALVGVLDALHECGTAALKEVQDALRAHERSEHAADPELLH